MTVGGRHRPISRLSLLALLLLFPAPPALGQTEAGERIYQRMLKSCAWVISPRGRSGGGGLLFASGTGSLIDLGRKLVLTNYHVVQDHDAAIVFFPAYHRADSGRPDLVAERHYYENLLRKNAGIRGRVVARDTGRDLALVQLESVPAGALAVPFAREGVVPGQHVHSVGNPGKSGGMWVYTPGTVRAVYHKAWKVALGAGTILTLEARVIETDSPTNAGDSGGPLVNGHGELVGVTQGGVSNAQLLSTFIDVGEVKAFLRQHKVRIHVGPAVALSAEPAAAADEGGRAGAVDKAAQAERDASRKLKLANLMAEDGLLDKARVRYQEIVETFPNTKAADEARRLLEKLKTGAGPDRAGDNTHDGR